MLEKRVIDRIESLTHCRVHGWKSGRIWLLKDGTIVEGPIRLQSIKLYFVREHCFDPFEVPVPWTADTNSKEWVEFWEYENNGRYKLWT